MKVAAGEVAEHAGRRRQQRGVATREKLLAAARVLFASAGYEGTSIGDVARQAGVGVGTVYHHFADKRALLLELLDRQHVEAGARLVDATGGPLARAFAADDFVPVLTAGMLTVRALRRAEPATSMAVVDLARRDPEVDRTCRETQARFIGFVRADIEKGMASGRARQDLDPAVAARVVWTAFEAVLRRAVDEPDAAAEELMRELCAMLAAYLLAD